MIRDIHASNGVLHSVEDKVGADKWPRWRRYDSSQYLKKKNYIIKWIKFDFIVLCNSKNLLDRIPCESLWTSLTWTTSCPWWTSKSSSCQNRVDFFAPHSRRSSWPSRDILCRRLVWPRRRWWSFFRLYWTSPICISSSQTLNKITPKLAILIN